MRVTAGLSPEGVAGPSFNTALDLARYRQLLANLSIASRRNVPFLLCFVLICLVLSVRSANPLARTYRAAQLDRPSPLREGYMQRAELGRKWRSKHLDEDRLLAWLAKTSGLQC